MKCEEVESVLVDYLDNNVDEKLRGEIEKHLATCERCLDEMNETQQVLNLFSKDEMAKPDDSLRINFYHMLHNEIKRNAKETNAPIQISSAPWYTLTRYRAAADIALLVAGVFLGIFIRSEIINHSNTVELSQLQTEVSALKRDAVFTMLKDESSSYRIQAVNFASDIENADQNVIDVLINTLNTDKNVNVRMAAAFALSKYAGQTQVCDSLVKSLSRQTDPILQVTLINILVERSEKKAIAPIQNIIQNEKTLKEVRAVAETGIKTLL